MDLDRRLRCLTLNPALRFTAMSSSSQTMKGTLAQPLSPTRCRQLTGHVSGLILAVNEDEDGKKAQVERKKDADGGVVALCTG